MDEDATRVEALLTLVRGHGKRVTSAKRAVVSVLVASEGHLTAEEVTAAVQSERPDVSPSTVYRILDELGELAVVTHSHAGHGAAEYHLAEHAHAHVTCESCHTTFEVPSSAFDRLAEELRDSNGFVLDRHHVALSGRCARCQGLS